METFYIHTDIQKGIFVSITDPNETLHACMSLRIKPGEMVDVINGKGDRYRAEVLECNKKQLVLMPLEKEDRDSEYSAVRLTVAVSLLNKNSKMKLLMEKLTELGISGFIPFISDRTSFPKMKTESLRPSMISALKQCGGSLDVKIWDTLKFKDITELGGFDGKYFSDMTGDELRIRKEGNILAVVGPEGGFTSDEKKLMIKAGFAPIKLNKRTLRAETAAIVTASKFLD
ncbi:MAG TPA: RsmE family RNA methyltransferase [Clostridiales bacterium]|nr:RsmE family RNA methyltransferase [Clostridiales bacterium]